MSDTGSPPRRSGVARPLLATLLGIGVVGAGAWVAQRYSNGALLTPPPHATAASMTVAAPAPASPDVALPLAPATETKAEPPPSVPADARPNAAAPDRATPEPAAPQRKAEAAASDGPPERKPVAAAADVPPGRNQVAAATDAPAEGRHVATATDPPPRAPAADPAAATEQRPSFDIVRVSPHGETVVAGRAAPDTEVALLDNGRPIAHGRADASGQFVLLPDKPLPAGGQELSLQARPPGGKPVAGEAPALLVVPPDQPAKTDGHPAPTGVTSNPGALAVLTPLDAAPRVLQAPGSEQATPSGHVALTVVDYDEHGAIRFAGTARPGGVVRLYIDDHAAGDAAVDAQGHWSLLPRAPVGPGGHRLRADELGARGQVLSRAEVPFQRATFGAEQLREGRVVVQPRQTLWRIARIVYGHGVRYTVIFQANRDQIRDPSRIYPGQVFALPAAPAEGGSSSASPLPSSAAK